MILLIFLSIKKRRKKLIVEANPKVFDNQKYFVYGFGVSVSILSVIFRIGQDKLMETHVIGRCSQLSPNLGKAIIGP